MSWTDLESVVAFVEFFPFDKRLNPRTKLKGFRGKVYEKTGTEFERRVPLRGDSETQLFGVD